METTDISGRIKLLIKFGLIFIAIAAGMVGYGVFEHYHSTRTLQIENAKVTGTMVSVRTLVNGKVSEFLFEDGAEVKAGDVIARLEVSVTEETIHQLEETVELARANYAELQVGTWVKVPVVRTRVVQTPVTTTHGGGSSNLAALEERANRMKELFEMGAVSATQRDAAINAYESAKAQGGSSYTESGTVENYVEEIEYVDELQPTPEAVLYGAEQAIKQAELSLNVALQQAQETEIIAPVDGTIFYSAEVETDLKAGNVVAKIGDSNELWLAAEVDEEVFNKVALGKLVSYAIDGKNLSGIVIEKISPDSVEEEVPVTENSAEENVATENATENTTAENITAENTATGTPPVPQVSENQTDTPPEDMRNDKFILRVSLPTERNFECKPNSTTTIKVKI